jgi:hypothetical protein
MSDDDPAAQRIAITIFWRSEDLWVVAMRLAAALAGRGLTLVELLVHVGPLSLISIAAATLFISGHFPSPHGSRRSGNWNSECFALNEVMDQAARVLPGYQNYTQRNGSSDDNSRRMVGHQFSNGAQLQQYPEPTTGTDNNATVAAGTAAANNGKRFEFQQAPTNSDDHTMFEGTMRF